MILGCSYALQSIFASVELRRVVLSTVQNILIQYPNTDINPTLLTDEIVSSMQCDQIEFFQATSILAQNVKKRHGKFLASQQSDRISDKQETLTL